MDFITNNWSSFISLMKTFSISDFFDIAITSFIIYSFIKLIRETRASQLVKGILILTIAYFLSYQLKFVMLSNLLNKFFEFAVITVLVVFQPELRRALEQIGRSKIGKHLGYYKNSFSDLQDTKSCINSVVDAVTILQKTKTGALIIFERETKLGDIIDTGTTINAIPSVSIIGNIFFNKAPLHDGAVIVRDDMIYAAGCVLPLTKNKSVSIDLGTRHRAALGISEISDAVAVVVSEETGIISIAINGVLTRNYTKEHLKNKLDDIFFKEVEEFDFRKQVIKSIRRIKKQ
ncbi:MAG: Cyclic di-AMP synthase CdaA [Eubacteriales bacterium SKADARSKE-1]|nr:Cyclic di-AMP synthase CdaA [Eubacteriales bacterium SKADARSKE-1]